MPNGVGAKQRRVYAVYIKQRGNLIKEHGSQQHVLPWRSQLQE